VTVRTGDRVPLGAVHVKDLERWTSPGLPPAPGWVAYGPQPPIRFRGLDRGTLLWPQMIDALLAEGYTGVVHIEHEDVLVPRDQSIAVAARRLAELLPVTSAEGRTW
jgi:sugar phosphate isomerase/epimerase